MGRFCDLSLVLFEDASRVTQACLTLAMSDTNLADITAWLSFVILGIMRGSWTGRLFTRLRLTPPLVRTKPTCWSSFNQYEGPGYTDDQGGFMLSVVLDAEAWKLFSSIRIVMVYRESERLRNVVRLSVNLVS